MRIFFIGDIVGKPGRKILARRLAEIRESERIDLVVANGENSAGGNGITKKMAAELTRSGVDAITLGDHLWDQRCLETEIDSVENMCRPANIPAGNPGREYLVIEKNGLKIGIFCILGQTLMKIKADCPFAAANRILEKLKDCDIIFADFHSETSSEKVSMGWHLDGRATAMVGTHTHIPTADARIFPQGLAFQSDAGMTGPWYSCLGRRWDAILQKFVDGRPRQFLMAEGDDRICGVIIDIDDATKKATHIAPYFYPKFPQTPDEYAKQRADEELLKAEEAAAVGGAKPQHAAQTEPPPPSEEPQQTPEAKETPPPLPQGDVSSSPAKRTKAKGASKKTSAAKKTRGKTAKEKGSKK